MIESPQSSILLACSDTATFPSVWVYLGTGKQPGISNRYRIVLPLQEINTGPNVTVGKSNSGQNNSVVFDSNSGKTNSNSGPNVTQSVIDPEIKKRVCEDADPDAGFWDQKPTSDGTANAVHTHARIKSKKKLSAKGNGMPAPSLFSGQGKGERSDSSQRPDPGTDNKALHRWFRSEVVAQYPKNRLGHVDAAFSWLKTHRPDEAARTAIVQHLEAWKDSAEWQRNDGQYVCDIANFIKSPKYQQYPPDYTATPAKPQDKEAIWTR